MMRVDLTAGGIFPILMSASRGGQARYTLLSRTAHTPSARSILPPVLSFSQHPQYEFILVISIIFGVCNVLGAYVAPCYAETSRKKCTSTIELWPESSVCMHDTAVLCV